MSTCYYLACETCEERYWIGQSGWKFFTFYSGEEACMRGIGDFIGKHTLCDGSGLRIMPEAQVDEFTEIKWPTATTPKTEKPE